MGLLLLPSSTINPRLYISRKGPHHLHIHTTKRAFSVPSTIMAASLWSSLGPIQHHSTIFVSYKCLSLATPLLHSILGLCNNHRISEILFLLMFSLFFCVDFWMFVKIMIGINLTGQDRSATIRDINSFFRRSATRQTLLCTGIAC